jgi:hypothetical protein
VRHAQVRAGLLGVLQPCHGADIGRGRDAWHVRFGARWWRGHRHGLGDGDRVGVAELPVEIGDADHHLGQLAQFGGTPVGPRHQGAHQASAFVGPIGRDEFDLGRRDRHAAQHEGLVQQGRRGHHAATVHHDGAGRPVGIRVGHDEAVVDRVLGFAAIGEQGRDLVEIGRAGRAQHQAAGQKRVAARMHPRSVTSLGCSGQRLSTRSMHSCHVHHAVGSLL